MMFGVRYMPHAIWFPDFEEMPKEGLNGDKSEKVGKMEERLFQEQKKGITKHYELH